MRLSRFASLALLFLALPVMAMAAEPTPAEVAQRLQQAYDRTTSFSARFEQRTTVPMSNRTRKGSGTVVFQKPYKMRWDYQQPETQVLVSDGKKVSLYMAASRQLMVRAMDEYLQSDVTYAFFSGRGRIVRDFTVAAAPAEKQLPGALAIKLTPKTTHPQVDYLYLWVDPQQYFITRLEVVDQFGSVTTLSFSGIEINPAVGGATFQFTPPAGTEILAQ
ncbi:MAG TPA: outer membrane lipoprotein carrier protein LolA [Desulfurivibrionaceae bacterium]|nr:outer membrane lipoprotein carrier protein LolA [Desulfurivibrionaceae bacterium]